VEKTSRSSGLSEVLRAFQQELGSDALVKSAGARRRDSTYQIEILVGRKAHRLWAHWVGNGWPERTRELIKSVRRPWPRNHVVVARQFSEATRALLRRLDANWLDQSGDARIVTASGFLVLTKSPPPSATRSKRTSHWTSATADVAEILLATRRVPSLKEISSLSGWQPSAVGKALTFFDSGGWTRKTGSVRGIGARRILVDPEALREAWAPFVASEQRPELLGHALMRDPLLFLERDIAPALKAKTYAVSGWAGLQLVAPFLTSVPLLHVYLKEEVFDSQVHAIMRRLNIREVRDGARIVFWAARPAAFVEPINSPLGAVITPVVHPSRLYADLLSLGDRGKDAAQHLVTELPLSKIQNDRARPGG
jgi:hypothetical protein